MGGKVARGVKGCKVRKAEVARYGREGLQCRIDRECKVGEGTGVRVAM